MDMYEIVVALVLLYTYIAIIVYMKASRHENAFVIAALWLPLGFLIFGFVFGSALLSAWNVFWSAVNDV